MASVTPHDPAHSAAWHVGLGVGDLALCGLTLGYNVRLTSDDTNATERSDVER